MSGGRKIIIDDMHHIRDVKTASCNTCGNQDRTFRNLEGATIESIRESDIEYEGEIIKKKY